MTTGDKGELFNLFVPLFFLLSKIVCSLWIYDARAQLLLVSLNLLFGDVLVAAVLC